VSHYSVDEDLSISKVVGGGRRGDTTIGLNEYDWELHAQGYTSITRPYQSKRHLDSMEAEFLLETHAHNENPCTLCVGMISSCSGSASDRKGTKSIEVDLSGAMRRRFVENSTSMRKISTSNFVSMMGTPIKTCAFHERTKRVPADGSSTWWKVVCIDSEGNILQMRFDFYTLQPLDDTVEFISTSTLLQDFIFNGTRSSQYGDKQYHQMTSSQVAFLDSNRVMLAMAPDILCVSLPNRKIVQWNSSKCLETKLHDSRQHGLGQILKNAGGLLIGKSNTDLMEEYLEEEEQRIYRIEHVLVQSGEEMPSTAALCVMHDWNISVSAQDDDDDTIDCVNEEPRVYSMTESTPRAVCSLHSDGTIRLWHLPDAHNNNNIGQRTSMYPVRMCYLHHEVDDVKANYSEDTTILPPPYTWSSDHDSVSMASYFYQEKIDNDKHDKFLVCVCINTAEGLPSTNTHTRCHLNIFSGDFNNISKSTVTIEGKDYSYQQQTHESRALIVPENVKSLIGMNFCSKKRVGCKTDIRYELHVIYHADEMDRAEDKISTKSWSSSSRLCSGHVEMGVYNVFEASHPTQMSNIHTLDFSAKIEREDMLKSCNLFAEKQLEAYLGEKREDRKPLKEEIKSIETWYMKCLFRSSFNFLQCDSSEQNLRISRVLKMLVPKNLTEEKSGQTTTSSIEALTLVIMREWVKLDETSEVLDKARNMREVSLSPQPSSIQPEDTSMSDNSLPSSSVYHDFCIKERSTGKKRTLAAQIMPIERYDTSYDIMNCDAKDEILLSAIHHKWMRLILSVWNEEAKSRFPLIYHPEPLSCPIRDSAILVRAEAISKLLLSDSKSFSVQQSREDYTSELDKIALQLLNFLQDKSLNCFLSIFEMQVDDIITKAKLFSNNRHEVFNALSQHIVNLTSIDISVFASEVSILIQKLKRSGITRWLSTYPSTYDNLRLSPILLSYFRDEGSNRRTERKGENWSSTTGNILSTAACASILVRQFTKSTRQIVFARYLMVSFMASDLFELFNPQDVNDSLRTYLNYSTLTWVNNQMVHLSLDEETMTPKDPSMGYSQDHQTRSPQKEKSRSCFTRPPQRSILSLHLQQMAREMTLSCSSLDVSVIQLFRAFIRHTVENESNKITNESILPDDLKTEYFHLRLLAPAIAFPPKTSKYNSLNRQKEIAADCLLTVLGTSIQKNKNEADPDIILRIWECASELLIRVCPEYPVCVINNADELLNSLISGHNKSPGSDGNVSQDSLRTLLQSIVDPSSKVIHCDIINLSDMETVKNLFQPFIASAQSIDVEPIALILQSLPTSPIDSFVLLRHLVLIFMNIANLLHRVAVLERHVAVTIKDCNSITMKNTVTEVLYSAISDVIEFIRGNFTSDVIRAYIVEYATLWSTAFHHCLRGLRWDGALNTCISNPNKTQREKNFITLVRCMADKGALGLLFQKVSVHKVFVNDDPSALSMNVSTQGVTGNTDLYQLMITAFADAISDSPDFDISSYIPNKQKANYVNCLFATHAMRGEWRRCCEAIEHYGSLDCCYQQANTHMDNTLCNTNSLNPDSQGRVQAINALSLAYLVSFQFINLEADHRRRFVIRRGYKSNLSSPHFLGVNHIEQKRNIGEGFDSEMKLSNAEHLPTDTGIFLSEKDLSIRATKLMTQRILQLDPLSSSSVNEIIHYSNPQIIDILAHLGYYSQAILHAQHKNRETQGMRPGGCDITSNALSHICCKHLVPNITIDCTSSTGEISLLTAANEITKRPSFSQLHEQSHKSPLLSSYETWRSRSMNSITAKENAIMEVLRRLVIEYSCPNNTLATDVAISLLHGLNAQLPQWLIDTLMIKIKREGLFGNVESSSTSTGSNPASLLHLLIDHGLYVQACETIHSVFQCHHESRKNEAVSRFPEKGHCDFVPYNLIDVLFTLIEEDIKVCSTNRKVLLLSARDRMQEVLQRHFNLMKVSEVGMLSARALDHYG